MGAQRISCQKCLNRKWAGFKKRGHLKLVFRSSLKNKVEQISFNSSFRQESKSELIQKDIIKKGMKQFI